MISLFVYVDILILLDGIFANECTECSRVYDTLSFHAQTEPLYAPQTCGKLSGSEIPSTVLSAAVSPRAQML